MANSVDLMILNLDHAKARYAKVIYESAFQNLQGRLRVVAGECLTAPVEIEKSKDSRLRLKREK
jgi:hypothetical protein